MTIRYSNRAVRHLEHIHDYISRDDPESADRTIESILTAASRLRHHPKLGREGRVEGTRELIHPPFILVYRIKRDLINLEAIFHGIRSIPSELNRRSLARRAEEN